MAVNTNAALYGFNWAADGSISASAEVGAMVAENLLDSQPGKIWRGAGRVEHTLEGGLGGEQSVSAFALIRHNLHERATVRLELARDQAFTNVVLDMTWDAVSPMLGWGEGTWGADANIGGYINTAWGSTHLIKSFDSVYAAYYRVTISNLYDQDVGYPEAGNLFLGSPFQPARNVRPNPSIPVEDPSELVETRGQALRAQSKQPYRVMSLEWHLLTAVEAREFRDLCRRVGRRSTMIVTLWPGDADLAKEQDNQFLARLVDWDGPHRNPDLYTDYFEINVTLREAL